MEFLCIYFLLYWLEYENNLEDDLGVGLGDDLRSLILDMISGEREVDETVDMEKVMEDADVCVYFMQSLN